MLFQRAFVIIFFAQLLSFSWTARAAEQRQVICDNPNSCANLGCVKTCEDKWQNGQCLGGYCPKGIAPDASAATSTVELHLYNVSHNLELEIRKLIDKGM
jgi:hypothetical protein